VILLLSSIAAYTAGKLIMGRRGYAMIAKATVSRQVKKHGLTAMIIVLASLPHIGVVLLAVAEKWQGPSCQTSGRQHTWVMC
jgi:hypothetical protein